MKWDVKIILSENAKKTYDQLAEASEKYKTEKMLFNSVRKKLDLISWNPHYGNPIAKNLIPDEYVEKYQVDKLFRVELSAFWRMLYTLSKNEKEIVIVAFVIDIINHNEYNKKFGYKKI